MSPRRALTEQEVWDACDELWNNNEVITVRSVRTATKRGSWELLCKYIKSWKKKNNDLDTPLFEYYLSSEIQRQLISNGQQLANVIATEIQLQFNDETVKTLETENDLLNNKLEVAESEIIRLNGMLQERASQRDDYFKQIIDLNQQLKELKVVLNENNSSFSKAYEIVQKVGINNLDLFIKIIGNPRVYELVMEIAANPEKYQYPLKEEKET